MSYSTYNRRRGPRPCPTASRSPKTAARTRDILSAPLGGESWTGSTQEGKRTHPHTSVCVSASPRLCSSCRREAGAAWLLTAEGEGLDPRHPCCLCWTHFSSLSVSAGAWGGQQLERCGRGGLQGGGCPGQRGWRRAALPLPSTCSVSHQGRALGSLLVLKV